LRKGGEKPDFLELAQKKEENGEEMAAFPTS
jgi:hypothetical protein